MFSSVTIMLISVVMLSLGFDFINGFHDTANSIATSVSTRVLSPRQAVFMAAILNVAGALFNEKVAETVASGLININMINQKVIIAALMAAIAWNLVTWYFGIPSSSTHALFGGIIGSAVAFTAGYKVLKLNGIVAEVLIPLISSPVIGFILGFMVMKLLYGILRPFSQKTVNTWFSKLQILSAAFMAFNHGSNDTQKSMGVITMALISANVLSVNSGVPLWVTIICATAMGLGTTFGGWKIIKTIGVNMIKLQPVHGFAAETAAATVIAAATTFHAPVSTTQIISCAIMGVGSTKRLSAVRWGLAKNIVFAWILTIPTTAIFGAIIIMIIK